MLVDFPLPLGRGSGWGCEALAATYLFLGNSC